MNGGLKIDILLLKKYKMKAFAIIQWSKPGSLQGIVNF